MSRKYWLFIALLLITLTSCQLGVNEDLLGSVTVDFGTFVKARTILPPISMDVTQYEISATGPAPNVIAPTIVTEATTFRNLVPGSWSFTVVGMNAAGDPIGGGSGTTNVVIGQTSHLAITVREYTGPGSFKMNLAWEPDTVEYPHWDGQLKDRDSIITPMPFVTDQVACTSVSTVENLHEGYYAMVVRLYNDPSGTMNGTQILATGAAAIVRIAKGYQTTGSYVLHAVQGWGEVEIVLSLEMNDPLILTPSDPFGDVQVWNDEVRTFSLTADEACTTVFYLRGQQVGIDSYDLIANELMPGEVYRLDALAFSTDGSRAASGTWLVQRGGFAPDMVRISGTTPSAPSWPADQNVRYTLRAAADPDVILNTITVPNRGSGDAAFSFESVPVGTYVLKMEWVEYNNTAWSWWKDGMSIQHQGAIDSNCHIIVPHTPRQFNFSVSF